MAVKIGSLIIQLALEHGLLKSGLTKAEKDVRKTTREIEKTGRAIADFGQRMATAVTVPAAAIGVAVVKMAGDFEASMGKVKIATKGTATEMSAMSELALKIGKDTTFGATEAADAMDMLAKNGLEAKQILGGAAEAAVNLAAAAGSDLAPAANAITDVMQQFKITAGELPTVVNQITGAVNESKLDFADFTEAIGQAGGVAASSGVDFLDFNAVIAGTSSLFASGSDAGTSFKTFLLALGGNSKEAAGAIETLGLKFYDAQGNLRSMGQIAEELKTKLGGMSEAQRTATLKTIFGNDAMRTAVGLMDLGAAGLEKISAKIAETNAAEQAAERMKGFNGQLENLKGAIETLAIRIGQSGLLESVTVIVTKLADFIDGLSQAAPWVLQLGTGLGVFAATLGPVAFVIGKVVTASAGLVAMLGGWPTVLSVAGTALNTLLMSPLGLVVGAVAAVVAAWYYWDEIVAIVSRVGSAVSDWLSGTLGVDMEAVKASLANFGEGWDEFAGMVSASVADVVEWLSKLWAGPFGQEMSAVGAAVAGFVGGVAEHIGDRLGNILEAAVILVSTVFEQIGNILKIVTRLLQGDFAGSWEAAKAAAVAAVEGVLGIVSALFPEITGYVSALYRDVKLWLQEKLGAVLDWLSDKVRTVTGVFFEMYDAVVGNSYVPDMVDEIGAEFARLQALMVDPSRKATADVTAATRKMATDVTNLLDRLFPEFARARQLSEELALLDGAGLSDDVRSRARLRLVGEGQGKATVSNDLLNAGPLVDFGAQLEALQGTLGKAAQTAAVQTVQIAESFREMADRSIQALDRMVNAFKGGSFLDILGSVIGFGLQLGGMGVFGKKIQTNINAPLRGAANGTAFHPGGLLEVGERGPEILQVPRGGRVIPNHELRQAGQSAIRIILDERTDIVEARIGRTVAGAAPAIMEGSAKVTAARFAQRQSRRIG